MIPDTMQGSYYNIRTRQTIHIGYETVHVPIGGNLSDIRVEGECTLVYSLANHEIKIHFSCIHNGKFQVLRWNRSMFTRDAVRRLDDRVHPGQFKSGEFIVDVMLDGELRWKSPNYTCYKHTFNYVPDGYNRFRVYDSVPATLIFNLNTVQCIDLFAEAPNLILPRGSYRKRKIAIANRSYDSSSSSDSSISSHTEDERAVRIMIALLSSVPFILICTLIALFIFR